LNHQVFGRLVQTLEVASVILLLLFGETVVVPDFVRSAINVLSYGIVIVLVASQWKRVAYVATTNKTLLCLVAVGVCSVFWSESPPDTAEQVRALVRSTLFGIYLATRYTLRQQIHLLSWVGGISIVSCLIAGFAAPSYGTHIVNDLVSWRGIYAHKQHMGRFMGFVASIFLMNVLDKRSNRWIALVGIFFSLILVRLSTSKTGLIVFLFSLSILPLYKIAKQKKYRAFFLIIALLILSTLATLILVNLETIVVDFLGKDIEFNGRTPLWTLIIDKGLERPLTGYGYNAFWTTDACYYVIKNTWLRYEEWDPKKPFQAHNGFVDLFVQLGFVGLLLFTFDFFKVLYKVVNILFITRTIESFWMFLFLGLYLVVNSSEVITIMATNSIFWIFYVSIAFSSSLQIKQIRKNQLMTSSSQVKLAL